MSKKRYVFILIIVFVVVLIFLGFRLIGRQFIDKKNTIRANSDLQTVTTQANWDLGTKTNIDSTTSLGSIKIDNKVTSGVDLGAIFTADNNSVEVSQDAIEVGSKGDVVDGNTGTQWGFGSPPVGIECPGFSPTGYWRIDLGEVKSLSGVRLYAEDTPGASFNIQISDNDSDYTTEHSALVGIAGWYEASFSVSARYLKILIDATSCNSNNSLYEVEATSTASATHTTGATQINGGANFWSWDGFTPTDTEPANTSITYRYRSSADGATWNAWHSAIGDVEDRSGDDSDNPTLYRYLQVEATLANTDGVSTPTIDQYDIDYHTEVKPTAPSAQTAVTQ